MKVLILYPLFNIYGSTELAVVKLANFLSNNGENVAIATGFIHHQIRRSLRTDDIRIKDFLKEQDQLKRWAKDSDAVICFGHPTEAFLYPEKLMGVWYLPEIPEAFLKYMDSKEMPLLIPQTIFDAIRYKRAFKSFFTNTEFNQRFIGELYKVNVELLRYGVDYDYWSKGSSDSEDIKAFRIKDKDYVILHSGYISPYGNQKQSVLALDKVKDKIPNVKLVFTGFNLSDYAQELVNLVTPSLEKHIIFLPFLNRDTLRDLYARSDLILCLNKLRGGILTVYEAACLNKLILVSELHPDLDFILRHNLAIKAEDLSQYILKAYEGLITPNTPREWIKNELTWKRFEEGFYRILMPSCGTKVGGNNA